MEADDMSKPPPSPSTIADEKLRQYTQFLYERQAWTEERLADGKRREHMLTEAIRSERNERELERAMWKDIVSLLRRSAEIAEQDTASLQQILATVGRVSQQHLTELLEWVWVRSTPEEMLNMRRQRDALWSLVGLVQPFERSPADE